MNGFEKKYKIINVTTYQMIIILLFNNVKEINIKTICEKTEIPIDDVIKNIVCLTSCCVDKNKKSK